MGFWDFALNEDKVEQRSYLNYNRAMINSIFYGGTSSELLDVDDVLKIPTAKKCHDLIVGSSKDLKVKLYKNDEDGHPIEVIDDYRLNLLNSKPNNFSTAIAFKEKLFSDLLMYGNAYVEIVKDKKHKIEELWIIDPNKVDTTTFVNSEYNHRVLDVVYTVNGTGKIETDDMMHFVMNADDGIHGKGIVFFGNEIFKLGLNEIELSKSIMENGSAPSSVIETDTRLSEEAGIKLSRSWQNLFSGAKNKGRALILEEGLKYKPMSLNPNELGLTTSRTTTGSEICRLFGVPEALVDSKTTNVEATNIMLLQSGIAPLIATVENTLNNWLLTNKELEELGYQFKIDTTQVIKTTLEERYRAHVQAINGSFKSVNETRYEEGLEGFEHDFFKLSIGNTLFYPDQNVFFNPNNCSLYDANTQTLITPETQALNGVNGNNRQNDLKNEKVNKPDEKENEEEKE